MKDIENKLQLAIRKKIDVAHIDLFVGQRSGFNTYREDSMDILVNADIAPDPDHSKKLPDWVAVKDVAYWVFPFKRFSKIIGLYWLDDGTSALFHGLIYPP